MAGGSGHCGSPAQSAAGAPAGGPQSLRFARSASAPGLSGQRQALQDQRPPPSTTVRAQLAHRPLNHQQQHHCQESAQRHVEAQAPVPLPWASVPRPGPQGFCPATTPWGEARPALAWTRHTSCWISLVVPRDVSRRGARQKKFQKWLLISM